MEEYITAVHRRIDEILDNKIDFGKAFGLRSWLIDRYDEGVKVEEAALLAIDEFYYDSSAIADSHHFGG